MADVIEFLDFKINISTRETYKNNKKIDLQNKSYDLLVYLIANKGRAVSKDELINTVWDGRVVTDSALTHAVYKLRTALRDTKNKAKIIRTVRGYGLQFIPELIQQKITQSAQLNTVKKSKWKIYSLFILIGFTLLVLIIKLNSETTITEKISTSSLSSEPATLGFFSNSQENLPNDWLSPGINIYLNQLISYSNNASSEILFMKKTNINSATIPNEKIINMRFHNNKIQLSFIEDIKPSLNVSLKNIPMAIEIINQWVCSKILIKQIDCEQNILKLTNNNDFIIENYMRGISAIYNGDYENALNFLNICLQQDPNFLFARLSLAETYFKVSRYKKSISELQTMLHLTDNQKLIQQAHVLLGKNYFKTSEIQKSEKHLLKVINTISPDNSIKAIALMELSLVYQENAKLDKAYKYAKLSASILEKTNLPDHFARVQQIMGSIKKNTGDLEAAEKHLILALNTFEKTGNLTGLSDVLKMIGSVKQFQGNLKAAIAYANRGQKIVERQGAPGDIASNLYLIAKLQLEAGNLAMAAKNANTMWEIAINEDEPYSLMLANLLLGEVSSSQESYELALDHYQDALIITQDSNLFKQEVSVLCNMGKVALDGKFYNRSNQYLELCKNRSDELDIAIFKSVSRLYLGELARAQNNTMKSDVILKEALLIASKLKIDKLDYDIYLEFFYLYLDHNTKKAEQYLQQVPESFRDDFLTILAHAMLENKKSNYTKALQLILLAKQKGGENWIDSDQELLLKIKANI